MATDDIPALVEALLDIAVANANESFNADPPEDMPEVTWGELNDIATTAQHAAAELTRLNRKLATALTMLQALAETRQAERDEEARKLATAEAALASAERERDELRRAYLTSNSL